MITNIVLLILIILIIFMVYYVFVYYKPKSTDDIILEYILNNDIRTVYTLNKTKNGYLNAFYDSKKDIWYEKETEHAYDRNGKIYKPVKHGDIIPIDNGFKITGIDQQFTCTPPFFWNGKECKLGDICKNRIGYVGLDEFNMLGLKGEKKYHEKLYLECPLKTIVPCGQYEIYKNKEFIPLGENPCKYYDICIHKSNGFVHNVPFKPLPKNSYFKCQDGKSVIVTCKDPLIFDSKKLACVEKMCTPKNKKLIDKYSYKVCNNNGEWNIVNCEWGVNKFLVECNQSQNNLYPKIIKFEDILGGVKEVHTVNINNKIANIIVNQAKIENVNVVITSIWNSQNKSLNLNKYELVYKNGKLENQSRLIRLGYIDPSPLSSIKMLHGRVLKGCIYNTTYDKNLNVTKILSNTIVGYDLNNPISLVCLFKNKIAEVYVPCDFGILKLGLDCVASDGYVVELNNGPHSFISEGKWFVKDELYKSITYNKLKYNGSVFPLVGYVNVKKENKSYTLDILDWFDDFSLHPFIVEAVLYLNETIPNEYKFITSEYSL